MSTEISNADSTAYTIQMPCLACVGSVVVESTKNGLKAMLGFHHLGGNKYLVSNASMPAFRLSWLIDASGKLFRAKYIFLRRSWLRRLNWLNDYVQAECEMEVVPTLTAADIIFLLKETKSPSSFSTSVKLRKFAKAMTPDAVFNPELFRTFWQGNCQELEPSDWAEQLP